MGLSGDKAARFLRYPSGLKFQSFGRCRRREGRGQLRHEGRAEGKRCLSFAAALRDPSYKQDAATATVAVAAVRSKIISFVFTSTDLPQNTSFEVDLIPFPPPS